MDDGSGTMYDSFVIRVWRAPAGEELLRVEIEHVQTSAVYVGRHVPPGWIVETLATVISPPATAPDPAATP
jgi:hypothetical protein